MKTLYESILTRCVAENILDPGFARRDTSIDVAAKAGKTLLKTINSLHPRVTKSSDKIRFDFDSPADMAHPERAMRKILKAIDKMMTNVQASGNFNPSSNAQWTRTGNYFAACMQQEDGQYVIIVAQNGEPLSIRPQNTFWVEVYKTKDGGDGWVNNLMRSRWGSETSPDTIYAIALYLGLEI